MSKFDLFNINSFNSQDDEQSDFYISHGPKGTITETRSIQKLFNQQESILEKLDSLTGVTNIEKSIKSLLDDRFVQLSQQIKGIYIKISQISSKLDQKQKQDNSKSKNQAHDDLYQRSNQSVEQFDIDLGRQDSIQTQKDPFYYPNEAHFHSQVESNGDDYDQSIMLIEGDNNYCHLFDNSNALFHELHDVFAEMDLKFKKCQKLYDYGKMRQINFHEKIDNKMNIFLLMELENNQLLGAFTHLCFDPQPNYIPKQNPKSFFCNFKKNIYIYASRYNKTHSYDKNYLIFGNWEIKIKACDEILETNWGTNGDCFMNKQYGRSQKTNIKMEWMFGVGFQNKSIKIKRYSIYQFI